MERSLPYSYYCRLRQTYQGSSDRVHDRLVYFVGVLKHVENISPRVSTVDIHIETVEYGNDQRRNYRSISNGSACSLLLGALVHPTAKVAWGKSLDASEMKKRGLTGS